VRVCAPCVLLCRINSPYATNGGPHSYAACTTKGDLALLFIAAATDKQVRGRGRGVCWLLGAGVLQRRGRLAG
jgi:hypothetical protein